MQPYRIATALLPTAAAPTGASLCLACRVTHSLEPPLALQRCKEKQTKRYDQPENQPQCLPLNRPPIPATRLHRTWVMSLASGAGPSQERIRPRLGIQVFASRSTEAKRRFEKWSLSFEVRPACK